MAESNAVLTNLAGNISKLIEFTIKKVSVQPVPISTTISPLNNASQSLTPPITDPHMRIQLLEYQLMFERMKNMIPLEQLQAILNKK